MSDPANGAQAPGSDIRPIVAGPSGGRTIWVFAVVVMLCACLLFYALEARRTSSGVAIIAASADTPGYGLISSPPDIQIPTAGLEEGEGLPPRLQTYNSAAIESAGPRRGRAAGFVPAMPQEPAPYVAPSPRSRPSFPSIPEQTGLSPVYTGPGNLPASNGGASTARQGERVTATTFQNPSTTIPLGTVIQAVLETALDSNHAGFARAVVSKDVFGFDGTQILVPRGSRLVGDYKADLGAGQDRALIQWKRLMRPDGVMIDLDSPSADPLGRAGIKGKVDGHFLERFGGAILQSTLDIGVQLATRSVARDTVVVALPGTATTLPTVTPDKVQRTLTVRQGTSVSVFVSRDLDFSSITQ